VHIHTKPQDVVEEMLGRLFSPVEYPLADRGNLRTVLAFWGREVCVSELDFTREYLVLVTTDEEGELTGLRAHEDPRVGRVVRLFSRLEKLETFFEHSDENQRFMDMLEQLPEGLGSEDLVTRYMWASVMGLAPFLKELEIDVLVVDPLPDGFNPGYLPPHKL
jgi:hypothetical protein